MSDETLTPKVRKKLYAQVHAVIDFSTKTQEDAQRLATNFLARRGIVQESDIKFETALENHWPTGRNRCRATFSVSYKVHGGWRSDFIKKVESDAKDFGIEVFHLDVAVTRTEIPQECPRKDCFPCSLAVNPRQAYDHYLTREREKDAAPVTDEYKEAETERRRWRLF